MATPRRGISLDEVAIALLDHVAAPSLALVKSPAPVAKLAQSAAAAPSEGEGVVPDEKLVERFRGGDNGAFDTLVRRYQRPIFFLARRYLRHDADAQDIAQRALVQAFERVRSLRKDASFRTWVYRIAINLALNAVRDRKPEGVLPDDLAAPTAEPAIEAALQAQLRAAVAELPPKQRMVVELRIFDELPFAAVAAIAGCSEDAAKVNFHHAVKRLRARMTGQAATGAES